MRLYKAMIECSGSGLRAAERAAAQLRRPDRSGMRPSRFQSSKSGRSCGRAAASTGAACSAAASIDGPEKACASSLSLATSPAALIQLTFIQPTPAQESFLCCLKPIQLPSKPHLHRKAFCCITPAASMYPTHICIGKHSTASNRRAALSNPHLHRNAFYWLHDAFPSRRALCRRSYTAMIECSSVGVRAAERPGFSRRERASQGDFKKTTISRAKRSAGTRCWVAHAVYGFSMPYLNYVFK